MFYEGILLICVFIRLIVFFYLNNIPQKIKNPKHNTSDFFKC